MRQRLGELRSKFSKRLGKRGNAAGHEGSQNEEQDGNDDIRTDSPATPPTLPIRNATNVIQGALSAPSHQLLTSQDTSIPDNGSSYAFNNDVPSLAAKLWDLAYDELKREETELVDAYEKILTRQLENDHGSKAPEAQSNGIDQNNPNRRRQQMERLIKDGLAKIDREARLKESLSPALDVFLSVKNAISFAIQAIPEAALAWGGISVALQVRLVGNVVLSYTDSSRCLPTP